MLADRKPKLMAAGPAAVRILGLFMPTMREYLHTLYQFTDPWVVDDTAFRTTFGARATDLDEALAATFAWYRSAGIGTPAR